MQNNRHRWGIAMAMCAPLLATAQATEQRPSGSTAVEAARQLSYHSAFDGYKPYSDIRLANWRTVNDAVAAKPAGARTDSGGGSQGMSGMSGMPAMQGMTAPTSTPPTAPTRKGRPLPQQPTHRLMPGGHR
jgi:hypothetical protein